MCHVLFALAVLSAAPAPDYPAPPGDGWQWSAENKNWWRWSADQTVPAAPAVPQVQAPGFPIPPAGAGDDALAAVNAKRAARGLRPFLPDPGLTVAAQGAAAFRAHHGLFGHTSNDFAFVPPGSSASSAGCAAYPAQYGFMACCVYEGYTYAGAASVLGRDGRTYHHLFVR